MARDVVELERGISGERTDKNRGDQPALLEAAQAQHHQVAGPENSDSTTVGRPCALNFRSRIPLPVPRSSRIPYSTCIENAHARVAGSTAAAMCLTTLQRCPSHSESLMPVCFERGKLEPHTSKHEGSQVPQGSLRPEGALMPPALHSIPRPRRSERHPLHHKFDRLDWLAIEEDAIPSGPRRLRQLALVAENRARHLNNLSRIAAQVEDILLAERAASRRQELECSNFAHGGGNRGGKKNSRASWVVFVDTDN